MGRIGDHDPQNHAAKPWVPPSPVPVAIAVKPAAGDDLIDEHGDGQRHQGDPATQHLGDLAAPQSATRSANSVQARWRNLPQLSSMKCRLSWWWNSVTALRTWSMSRWSSRSRRRLVIARAQASSSATRRSMARQDLARSSSLSGMVVGFPLMMIVSTLIGIVAGLPVATALAVALVPAFFAGLYFGGSIPFTAQQRRLEAAQRAARAASNSARRRDANTDLGVPKAA
jgi:hypothetical protein